MARPEYRRAGRDAEPGGAGADRLHSPRRCRRWAALSRTGDADDQPLRQGGAGNGLRSRWVVCRAMFERNALETADRPLTPLQTAEARLRLAVDAARMAIWEYDVAAERLEATPELATFLGLTNEELGSIDALRKHYHPEDRERIRRAGEEALARGDRHFEVEFRFRRDGDDWRWLLLRAEIIFGAGGEPERVLGALLDITERKSTEEALRRLKDTLEEQVVQRSRELLRAEEALRQSQKMEAIGQLTGGVAHDFNNLLTIIRSSVDLIRRPGIADDRKGRYLEAISDTVDRAARLTGQLLAFARRQALAPQSFDAAERTRRICDMVKTVVGARVELDLQTECEGCTIEADVA